MTLILLLDILAVGSLCVVVLKRGFEGALPLAAFLLILFPNESQIQLPGLFDFTTQRIVVAALIVLYFSHGRRQRESEHKNPLPLRYLILLVIGWMLLSSVNSVVPSVSIKATLSQVFDFFVPYYIYAKTVSKTETVHEILFAFVSGTFLCSIFGFFEAYQGWSVLSLFPALVSRFSGIGGVAADRGIRVQSTFGHAILFGAALAMAIPLALYLLTVTENKWRKLFLWAAILLMFVNIYKTGSRGPWMALVLSLAILLVMGRGLMRKYLILIVTLAVIVLVARPGVWNTIADLYGETINPTTVQGQSYEWRYLLYDISKKELSKSVGRTLWGYGPESFYFLGLTAPFMVDGEMHMVKVESCDSAVVELMMDTGYVGFFLVAALLLKAGLLTLRNFFKMPKPENSLCVVFFANLAAFCFLMTSVELFNWGQQAYLLWIIIALSMIYPACSKRVSSPLAVIEPQSLARRWAEPVVATRK